MKPCLIGIAGPSCSGKTSLAHCVASLFSQDGSVVISLDSYYRDLSSLTLNQRAQWNFDIPESIDHALLRQQLQLLSQGQSIERPVYQFSSHTRANYGETVTAAPYIIFEGLFALYWQAIISLLDVKVFIDTADEVCLARRKKRDVEQRGRTPEYVVEQYNRTVRPMFKRYVSPTLSLADLIVRGEDPTEKSGAIIRDFVINKLRGWQWNRPIQ